MDSQVPSCKETDSHSSALIGSSGNNSDQNDLRFLDNLPPPEEPLLWEYSPGKFLAWNEYGDLSGTPVFYYHGWPSSRLQARIAHHLAADRGIRLIAMDRPGMGKSTFIRDRKLEDWPGLMTAFADHLGIERFGQLGVSGGGPYVLACAAEIPERLTASAVLAGMVPLPLIEHGRAALHPMYRLLIPFRKLPAPAFTLGFNIAARICKLGPDRFPLKILINSLAREDRVIMLHNTEIWKVLTKSFTEGVMSPSGGRGVMMDSEVYLRKPKFEVGKITHPIHYWHGGEDKSILAELVGELTRKMPAAQLQIDESLGHFSLAVHRAAAALDTIASTRV